MFMLILIIFPSTLLWITVELKSYIYSPSLFRDSAAFSARSKWCVCCVWAVWLVNWTTIWSTELLFWFSLSVSLAWWLIGWPVSGTASVITRSLMKSPTPLRQTAGSISLQTVSAHLIGTMPADQASGKEDPVRTLSTYHHFISQ